MATGGVKGKGMRQGQNYVGGQVGPLVKENVTEARWSEEKGS